VSTQPSTLVGASVWQGRWVRVATWARTRPLAAAVGGGALWLATSQPPSLVCANAIRVVSLCCVWCCAPRADPRCPHGLAAQPPWSCDGCVRCVLRACIFACHACWRLQACRHLVLRRQLAVHVAATLSVGVRPVCVCLFCGQAAVNLIVRVSFVRQCHATRLLLAPASGAHLWVWATPRCLYSYGVLADAASGLRRRVSCTCMVLCMKNATHTQTPTSSCPNPRCMAAVCVCATGDCRACDSAQVCVCMASLVPACWCARGPPPGTGRHCVLPACMHACMRCSAGCPTLAHARACVHGRPAPGARRIACSAPERVCVCVCVCVCHECTAVHEQALCERMPECVAARWSPLVRE
jgi:hypothetical protein